MKELTQERDDLLRRAVKREKEIVALKVSTPAMTIDSHALMKEVAAGREFSDQGGQWRDDGEV